MLECENWYQVKRPELEQTFWGYYKRVNSILQNDPDWNLKLCKLLQVEVSSDVENKWNERTLLGDDGKESKTWKISKLACIYALVSDCNIYNEKIKLVNNRSSAWRIVWFILVGKMNEVIYGTSHVGRKVHDLATYVREVFDIDPYRVQDIPGLALDIWRSLERSEKKTGKRPLTDSKKLETILDRLYMMQGCFYYDDDKKNLDLSDTDSLPEIGFQYLTRDISNHCESAYISKSYLKVMRKWWLQLSPEMKQAVEYKFAANNDEKTLLRGESVNRQKINRRAGKALDCLRDLLKQNRML